MRVIVIPDIHLKPWIFDRAERMLITHKAERAVCVMDIPDDWKMEFNVNRYRETYDRAIRFAKEYPDSLWCYGNHDLSYPWGRLETGYSPYAERTVISKLQELEEILSKEKRIAIIHRIDKVLFSHGGLSERFVKRFGEDIRNADIDEVLETINNASQDTLWEDDSPLWLRPQNKTCKAFRRERYIQVVGHTPVKEIYEKDGYISTDVFSTYRDGRQIGEAEFVIIETETGEYEKVKV